MPSTKEMLELTNWVHL